jgi:hypothetical protein
MLKATVAALAGLLLASTFLAGCPEETEDPKPLPPGQLAVPPKGEGLQFNAPAFDVAPGDEVQNCYFFKVGDLMTQSGLDGTKSLNLHRIELSQTDGSHHMNIFRVRTIDIDPNTDGIQGMDPTQGPYLNKNGEGECFKSPNWADWPLVANTQQDGHLDWTFPDGVANKIQPDEYLMVQSHFVNATTQKTPDGTGKVAINFWHLDDAEVKHEMGTLFATKQSVRVCQSNPQPSFIGSCNFNNTEPVNIIGANGHFHSRGKQFDMFEWDGQTVVTDTSSLTKFYASDEWDEPPMDISPKLDRQLPVMSGVVFQCDYQWRMPENGATCEQLNAYDKKKNKIEDDSLLDCCYAFGPQVEQNEHCNIFVYYYPKSDDVFCN